MCIIQTPNSFLTVIDRKRREKKGNNDIKEEEERVKEKKEGERERDTLTNIEYNSEHMTVWLDGASLLSQIFFVFFRDKKSWVVALKLWQSVYNNAVDFARKKLLEKKKKQVLGNQV